jgi:hypothetical protein
MEIADTQSFVLFGFLALPIRQPEISMPVT